jgi:glycine cleavage system aminomethyltransferase T
LVRAQNRLFWSHLYTKTTVSPRHARVKNEETNAFSAGHELSPMVTPSEAGLGFAVAWDKPGGFIGQQAAADAKARGNLQRCVNFKLDDPEAVLYGGA